MSVHFVNPSGPRQGKKLWSASDQAFPKVGNSVSLICTVKRTVSGVRAHSAGLGVLSLLVGAPCPPVWEENSSIMLMSPLVFVLLWCWDTSLFCIWGVVWVRVPRTTCVDILCVRVPCVIAHLRVFILWLGCIRCIFSVTSCLWAVPREYPDHLAAQGTLDHLLPPDLTKVMEECQGGLFVYLVTLQVVEWCGVP